MGHIVVRPESMRQLGRDLWQQAIDLRQLVGRLGSALNGLDWETRQKAGVESLFNSAMEQSIALAQRAQAMSQFLTLKADAFEEADRQSAANFSQVPLPPVPLPCPVPPQLPWPFPAIQWPTMPSRAELERLLKTLVAFKPVLIDFIWKKLGVDKLKDIWELFHMQQYMDEMDRARAAWEQAALQYGSDSAQAMAAREVYDNTYEHCPLLGPYIKALLDAGRANPVY